MSTDDVQGQLKVYFVTQVPRQFSLRTDYVYCFASHHQGILGDTTFKEITDKGNDLFLWNGLIEPTIGNAQEEFL